MKTLQNPVKTLLFSVAIASTSLLYVTESAAISAGTFSSTIASPVRTDTWMRDNWNDTGAEPSSGMIWLSPYLWVRNQADGLFLSPIDPPKYDSFGNINLGLLPHYQNPIGTTAVATINYVYVKLHHGSRPATSGTLAVYGADFTMGAFSNMTLLGYKKITSTPNSTEVVEIPWTIPKGGSRHICLSAIWASRSIVNPDPLKLPSVPASTIISSGGIPLTTLTDATHFAGNYWGAVQNNNNIINRNADVISISVSKPVPVTGGPVLVQNGTKTAKVVNIHFRPTDDNGLALFDFANVKIQLDKQVIAAWVKGGKLGKGFDIDDAGNLIINAATLGGNPAATKGNAAIVGEPAGGEAVLENITLPAGFKAPVTFTFETVNTDVLAGLLPGQTFAFDAFQEEVLKGGKTQIMGGFTHVIEIAPEETPQN